MVKRHYDSDVPEAGFGKEPRQISIAPLPSYYYSEDLADKRQFRFDSYIKEQNEMARKDNEKLKKHKYGSKGGM